MTQYDFLNLTTEEQFKVLNVSGVTVSERRTVLHKYLLYQVNSFYVEVKYDADMDCVLGMKPFNSMAGLEPYLKMINIKELFPVK